MALWENGVVRPLSESRGATERQKSGEGRMTARGTVTDLTLQDTSGQRHCKSEAQQVRGAETQQVRGSQAQQVRGKAGHQRIKVINRNKFNIFSLNLWFSRTVGVH